MTDSSFACVEGHFHDRTLGDEDTLSRSTVMWISYRRSERVSGEVTKTVTMDEDMLGVT